TSQLRFSRIVHEAGRLGRKRCRQPSSSRSALSRSRLRWILKSLGQGGLGKSSTANTRRHLEHLRAWSMASTSRRHKVDEAPDGIADGRLPIVRRSVLAVLAKTAEFFPKWCAETRVALLPELTIDRFAVWLRCTPEPL